MGIAAMARAPQRCPDDPFRQSDSQCCVERFGDGLTAELTGSRFFQTAHHLQVSPKPAGQCPRDLSLIEELLETVNQDIRASCRRTSWPRISCLHAGNLFGIYPPVVLKVLIHLPALRGLVMARPWS
jgi:hypothetical protein